MSFQFRVVWEDTREPVSNWVDGGPDAVLALAWDAAVPGRAIERRSVGEPELVLLGEDDTLGTPYDVVLADESGAS